MPLYLGSDEVQVNLNGVAYTVQSASKLSLEEVQLEGSKTENNEETTIT